MTKDKRNTMLGRGIRLALFVILAAAMFYLLCCVLRVKSENGIDQARGIYDQPKETVDVLFLGSSHAHCNVDTQLLWEEYGIAAYLYATAEQPLWVSYHYLVEALKTQSPRLIVLDMYSPAMNFGDIQEMWLAENIEGMRFSRNKYEMIKASTHTDHLSWLFGFDRYHDRYDKVSGKDFSSFFWNRSERARWKGFIRAYGPGSFEAPNLEHITEEIPMTDKALEYFGKITDLAEQEEIPLILINAPYILNEKEKKVYNSIRSLAGEEGIPFLDGTVPEVYQEMGIDFETDLADDSHLGVSGAEKYTRYLGNWFLGHHDLPDRRGQKGYESWENQIVVNMGH